MVPGERVETTPAQEEVWVGSEIAQQSGQRPRTDNMFWLSVLFGRAITPVQGEASFGA